MVSLCTLWLVGLTYLLQMHFEAKRAVHVCTLHMHHYLSTAFIAWGTLSSTIVLEMHALIQTNAIYIISHKFVSHGLYSRPDPH